MGGWGIFETDVVPTFCWLGHLGYWVFPWKIYVRPTCVPGGSERGGALYQGLLQYVLCVKTQVNIYMPTKLHFTQRLGMPELLKKKKERWEACYASADHKDIFSKNKILLNKCRPNWAPTHTYLS